MYIPCTVNELRLNGLAFCEYNIVSFHKSTHLIKNLMYAYSKVKKDFIWGMCGVNTAQLVVQIPHYFSVAELVLNAIDDVCSTFNLH